MGLSEAINGTDLTGEDESTLLWGVNQLQNEIDRRAALANAETDLHDLNVRIINAVGHQPGDPWDPAMRARGGYPKGATVTHDGDLFESLIDANVREPREQGDPQSYRWWKNLSAPPPAGQWNPNDHPYAVGDVAEFQGKKYRVRQAHRSQPSWTPAAVPALWEPVT